MKRLALASLLLGSTAALAQDQRVPVIVELFTSEGCSSCPPADILLARLERTQPVAGARILALEEHVDYWNQLGWTDPFSSPQFRARQNDYAVMARTDNIYTPQMVVSGQFGFVGDDVEEAGRAIAQAARSQTTAVELTATTDAKDPTLVKLSVLVVNSKNTKIRDANLYLAVTEDRLVSDVSHGENAGRRLRHSAVVRSFGIIGRMDSHGSSEGRIVSTLRLPSDWKRENLRAVAFVQERETLRITGAGITGLN
jgi:hypothetical protein